MDISIFLAFAIVVIMAVLILFPTNSENARAKRMLKKIPGPRSYPFIGSGLPMLFLKKKDRMNWIENVALSRKRPLNCWYFLSKPFVNVSSPELMEVVLRNTNLIDKSFLYDVLRPWLGDGLLTSTGSKWHLHRKIITSTFHFSILESFIDVFAEKAKILVDKLHKEVGKEAFVIRHYVSRCALDIICETAMGTSVNAQENPSEYVTAVNKMTQILSDRMSNPFLFLDIIFKLTTYYKTHEKCLKVIQGFVNKVIRERREMRQKSADIENHKNDDDIGRKKRVPFLDTLLNASEDGNALTDEAIRDEVHTFMFEGHDTVTAAMCWTLFELGHHPEIQEEAYKELDEIFKGSDRVPTMNDLNNMNYLERVIKESLRLHPSVLCFVRTARHDFELGGYIIPAGTNIDFTVAFIHKNPEIFPDPFSFNPDHFLPEKVLNRHPYAYIPFSAGPRNCIGQRFAILEEKVVLSYLLRHYKFRSMDKREKYNYKIVMINTPLNPLKFVIEPRQ